MPALLVPGAVRHERAFIRDVKEPMDSTARGGECLRGSEPIFGNPGEQSDLLLSQTQAHQQVFELQDRLGVAPAGAGLAQAEHPGRLRIVELLEMPQRDDFPIGRVERIEGILKADLHLGAHGSLARSGPMTEEAGCQGRR